MYIFQIKLFKKLLMYNLGENITSKGIKIKWQVQFMVKFC